VDACSASIALTIASAISSASPRGRGAERPSSQVDSGRPGTSWRTWNVPPAWMVSMRIGRGIDGASQRRAARKSVENAERSSGEACARETFKRTLASLTSLAR
jgi:hypothetical protein